MKGCPPPQMSAVFGRTATARTPNGRKIEKEVEKNEAATRARRDRVLAHEWARRRLCWILGLKSPDRWNGYIPPRCDQNGKPMAGPERALLVELIFQVAHFEETGEMPAVVPADDGGAE